MSRPLTSALIFARSRKIGRRYAERFPQSDHAHEQQRGREPRHHRTDAQQHVERDSRRQQAAQKFHEPRADQIPHAFDVAHDARDERARFIRIVVRHRQAPDVLLHFSPQLGDHPLRRFR